MGSQQPDLSWVKDMKVGLQHLNETSFRADLGDRPMDTVDFIRVERQHYVGEVGSKNGDFIYHFFLRQEMPAFSDKMGDAFLTVFRFPERLSQSHDRLFKCNERGCAFKGKAEDLKGRQCPDCGSTNISLVMDAWAVRAQGFANNPMFAGGEGQLFDVLDALLKSC